MSEFGMVVVFPERVVAFVMKSSKKMVMFPPSGLRGA